MESLNDGDTSNIYKIKIKMYMNIFIISVDQYTTSTLITNLSLCGYQARFDIVENQTLLAAPSCLR